MKNETLCTKSTLYVRAIIVRSVAIIITFKINTSVLRKEVRTASRRLIKFLLIISFSIFSSITSPYLLLFYSSSIILRYASVNAQCNFKLDLNFTENSRALTLSSSGQLRNRGLRYDQRANDDASLFSVRDRT